MRYFIYITPALVISLFFYCGRPNQRKPKNHESSYSTIKKQKESVSKENRKTAIFSGGCFWCVEADFEKHPAVIEAISGYTAGKTKNPNYEDYIEKGHREAVRVIYNSSMISFEELVEYLIWFSDPTDDEGSFVDRGFAYSPAVYYKNKKERLAAIYVLSKIARKGYFPKPLVIALEKRSTFYPAEEYHQNYAKKNPRAYNNYRRNSGRDQYVERYWTHQTPQKYPPTEYPPKKSR